MAAIDELRPFPSASGLLIFSSGEEVGRLLQAFRNMAEFALLFTSAAPQPQKSNPMQIGQT
jgi:hypothetical protein